MGIDELIAIAKRRGLTAISVTDHDTTAAATRAASYILSHIYLYLSAKAPVPPSAITAALLINLAAALLAVTLPTLHALKTPILTQINRQRNTP